MCSCSSFCSFSYSPWRGFVAFLCSFRTLPTGEQRRYTPWYTCAGHFRHPFVQLSRCRRWHELVCRRPGDVSPINEIHAACPRLPTHLFSGSRDSIRVVCGSLHQARNLFPLLRAPRPCCAGLDHLWPPLCREEALLAWHDGGTQGVGSAITTIAVARRAQANTREKGWCRGMGLYMYEDRCHLT